MTWTASTPMISFLVLVAISGCGRPPGIGGDIAAFRSVDALYTAVGMKDRGLVDQSEARLLALRRESKIPQEAFDILQSIVTEAKAGQWETAQGRLYRFMDGQTR